MLGPTPSREPGHLVGVTDNRLAPREKRVYGRETEVSEVSAFLRDGGAEGAAVVGVGGSQG